ncbi:helix-turn-helix domain-containing protein [Streptomyces diastatochromogenes]|uniref:CdaR family transcriptional regulator n=1 Tax=Streptomyces diastatochromogenes TaxID=42236 RepID=A0A233RXB7_STRDA|nr:helix-turn-helix domain-containing protein [Streptomyces diastatochromogenes]OXY87993.1 CdaR family transcriptional regulator [Streptomyces diastatochromogenes]
MKELAGRLAALDPDAGAAVRVIAYFDRLAESRAGLEALVRGAAVLAGCPARLVDAERRVVLRVEPDGRRRDPETEPDPEWPSAPLAPGGPPALWLERAEAGPSVVDAVILERAAGAVRAVLDRTRGRAPAAPADDPALVETLLDPTAPEQARLHAARRLGLDPEVRVRAVAPAEGPPQIVAAEGAADLTGSGDGRPSHGGGTAPRGRPGTGPAGSARLDGGGNPGPGSGHAYPGPRRDGGPGPVTVRSERLGIGPAVPVLDLPRSWAAARLALRFTAEGDDLDPGQRVVRADELGGIALLAELVVPGAEPDPDVRAVETAAADAPWMLRTLHAVAATASLRAAAAEAGVHHSTLQDRLAHAEHLLGWPVRTPQGRFRLQLALMLRHLTRGH